MDDDKLIRLLINSKLKDDDEALGMIFSNYIDIGGSLIGLTLAISALKAIVDPIGHMKKQLKEDERLDGMYAIRIAERPEFYQDIAKKALEEIANYT